MTESIQQFQEKLGAIKAELRHARSAAFVDYTAEVCGIELRPITFKTYQQLIAFGNAFVLGGGISFETIFQFIWIHHPDFGQKAHAARLRTLAQVHQALHPRWPRFNAFLHIFLPIFKAYYSRGGWRRLLAPLIFFLQKLKVPVAAERHRDAIEEIRRLMQEALQDFPAPDDQAEDIPYSAKPQMVSLMMRGYGLGFAQANEFVDTLPLKQLIEYIRETLHRLSDGRNKLLTPKEGEVWSDYLAFKTTAAHAARH